MNMHPERPAYRDAAATVKRIGMLTPSANTVCEPITSEILMQLRELVSVHYSRFSVTSTGLDPALLAQFGPDRFLAAAQLLADAEMHAIAFNGCAGSWMGRAADEAIVEKLEAATHTPATTTSLALWDAFKAFGIRRYSLVSPYNDQMMAAIRATYESEGYECVRSRNMALPTTREKDQVDPEQMAELIRSAADPKADAIAVICTNFRGAPHVRELEAELGIPIVDSVVVTAWKCLQMVGVSRGVTGWGRVFE